MPISVLLLLLSTSPCQPSAEANGTLSGAVVNISREKAPADRAEVLLQVLLNDELVSVEETIADDQGRFTFTGLPVGGRYRYLAGASRDGVHYPGPRVQLTLERPHERVELQVCDVVEAPNPLVIDRQEITISPGDNVLRVTELLVVENASNTCYVGSPQSNDGEPMTVRLTIPRNFEKVTFQREFFGRRFALVDGRLVTGIPWPPGRREIEFTYVLPAQSSRCVWERPLDLPCRRVNVVVKATSSERVVCNLPRAVDAGSAEAAFESGQPILPAGHTIRVEIRGVPVSAMAFGRWIALGLLTALVSAAAVVVAWRAYRHRGHNR